MIGERLIEPGVYCHDQFMGLWCVLRQRALIQTYVAIELIDMRTAQPAGVIRVLAATLRPAVTVTDGQRQALMVGESAPELVSSP